MKSNYFIDTSLLKSLSIGIKEAIVLDFLYYYNNRNCKSYRISITKIAEHLNIARGHLYKILGKLVKRELIVKSCREYIVTQNYISVRVKSFKEAHNNSKTSSDIIPNYVNKYSKTKQKNIANFTDTEMYPNESKVYPNESVSILYGDTNIQNSSILNARVDIKTNAKSKIKNIFDLICFLRGEGEKNNNLKSFVIPQKFIADIIQTCDKEIKRANGINFSSLKKILSDDEYELFMNYVKKLAHTGVFTTKTYTQKRA